ncbi:MAG TPA: C45 family autoproteolytic acyltransferase/hydrolase [Smithella sp.]|nr:hypothetical protein [Smithella sp.]HNY50787.1 C45 family autoproteolytic acyltransferase/hydrolase [Smithella sp.]HOG90731.1 C45 family autoproteolytic acyltransferase/hydrolase [Smithella sp.]HQG65848.1 C45 family autoproteolytic acyltransferase/hydrolase [Smithella sp.]HQH16242.1 C45 family autoproteolytic acyltransferase/hydrolase [Smithella sp.]
MNFRKKRFSISLIIIVSLIASASLSLSSQAYAARIYSPDGKGYLEYIMTDTGHAQPLLHLEGTGYEMGFQHGYLMGEAATEVASDELFQHIFQTFVLALGETGQIINDLVMTDIGKRLGLNVSNSGMKPVDFIIAALKIFAKQNEKYIPQEYLDEMRGIVDGARATGVHLKYEDVLLLNVGFDVYLSIVYRVGTPLLNAADKAGTLTKGLQLSCNAFAMDGKATIGDSLFLGRDFMFNGPGLVDNPVIFEIYGKGRNRFVNIGAAGMVGVFAAMNEKGLGIGMDMVPSFDCTPTDVGMGTAFTAREVMAKANELSQGVSIIKNSKRGVSWLYIVADGQGAERGATSVEVSANHVSTRSMKYAENTWLQKLLGTPARQQEKYPDVLIQTNHYILPNMYANYPLHYVDRGSMHRYDRMIEMLNDPNHPLGGYGTYDFDKAFDYNNWMYLTGEENETPQSYVNVSTTLFDLTNLRFRTLCGPTFGHGATEYDWSKRR